MSRKTSPTKPTEVALEVASCPREWREIAGLTEPPIGSLLFVAEQNCRDLSAARVLLREKGYIPKKAKRERRSEGLNTCPGDVAARDSL